MKLTKKILLGLLIVIIILQAFRPAKNESADTHNSIANQFVVSNEVRVILVKACNDCHSNHTNYPWYAEVQPVSWWLSNHVKDGKRHLNFDEFSGYRVAKQYKTLEECIEQVKQGEMPLESYTWIHKSAILTETEKQTLYNWCNNMRDSIKSRYPADSLVIKRR